jgi:hypothetical protein
LKIHSESKAAVTVQPLLRKISGYVETEPYRQNVEYFIFEYYNMYILLD